MTQNGIRCSSPFVLLVLVVESLVLSLAWGATPTENNIHNSNNNDHVPEEDHERSLGGGEEEEPVKIDYNALSVAAMTLTLLLMVGFFRSRLDRAARNRPFFEAVLEGVYAERTCVRKIVFVCKGRCDRFVG